MAKNKMTAQQLLDMPLLTIEQAAQVLQCSAEHLRRQARAGSLPGLVNVCGVYRVRTDALRAVAS